MKISNRYLTKKERAGLVFDWSVNDVERVKRWQKNKPQRLRPQPHALKKVLDRLKEKW
jgi:hypothetical protein